MKTKEKKEALEWFVSFANMDLETIKPGDKAKLLVEAEGYLWPKEELKEYPIPMSKKHLERLAWALEIPPQESQEYWTAVLESQKVVQQLFLHYLLPIARPSADRPVSSSEKPAPSVLIGGSDEMLWWVGKGHKSPYTIKIIPVAGSQADYLPLKIYTLLEGSPDHAIRRCPGCEKFFFNQTQRKKDFCSPRCMWRVGAEKRRKELKEKHPKEYKAYLEKQSEVMRERYEKNQKDKGYKKINHFKRKK